MSLVHQVLRHRRYLGLTQAQAAQAAGMSEGHWHDLESGRRANPHSNTLRKMGAVVGLDLELIPSHVRPFLDLDPGEAWEVMLAVQQYRRGRKRTPEVLVTAADKMERWTRGRRRR